MQHILCTFPFFNVLAVLFGVTSAAFWMASARVPFPTGYDMDEELEKATKKAAGYNVRAAALSAVSMVWIAAGEFMKFAPFC